MATVSRVRKLVNPARRRAPARRKMTLKQKLHFGTARQRSAARAALRKPRKRAVARAAPRKRAAAKVKRRKTNPGVLVTLGPLNPARKRAARKGGRKTTMARARRKTVRRRRRRNAVAAVPNRRRRVYRRRRRNVTAVANRSRRRSYRRRRRNPDLFGSKVKTTELMTAAVGGILGVTIAKLVPPALPPGMVSTPAMRVIATLGTALLGGYIVGQMDKNLGQGVMFGGLMQTVSMTLNAFVPAVGQHVGLGRRRGVGAITPGGFNTPFNPVKMGVPAASAMVSKP